VTQPDQRLGVQLTCPLAGETQIGADQTIHGRWIAVQTVTGYDDVLQPLRQAAYRIVQGLPHRFCFPHRCRVWLIEDTMFIAHRRRRAEPLVGLDFPPDLAHNTQSGVGGESQTPPGIKSQNGAPETDATCLQRFGEGQIAQYLLAHDGLDQAVVTSHQLVQAGLASRLRPLEQGGLGGGAGATLFVSLCAYWAPPGLRCPILRSFC
jgi:hypothetical protein